MNKFCIACGAELDEAAICPKCDVMQDTINALRMFCGKCGASHHDHPPIKREKIYVCPLCDAEAEKWEKKGEPRKKKEPWKKKEREFSKPDWFVVIGAIFTLVLFWGLSVVNFISVFGGHTLIIWAYVPFLLLGFLVLFILWSIGRKWVFYLMLLPLGFWAIMIIATIYALVA
ncbi:MAG: hypothetical protein JSV05_07800 [Candidatus Bathyarchaeota archaeon]|nr:MAG: hypothetical protein JSV05_07800 [Candidatus Bathyarchaeota archaeon]